MVKLVCGIELLGYSPIRNVSGKFLASKLVSNERYGNTSIPDVPNACIVSGSQVCLKIDRHNLFWEAVELVSKSESRL